MGALFTEEELFQSCFAKGSVKVTKPEFLEQYFCNACSEAFDDLPPTFFSIIILHECRDTRMHSQRKKNKKIFTSPRIIDDAHLSIHLQNRYNSTQQATTANSLLEGRAWHQEAV